MASRLNINVNKLFEVWCELRRVPGAEQNARTPAAQIIAKFPESVSDETLHEIAIFAFPCEFESTLVQLYTFVLTSGDSKWRFGFCRYDPKKDSTTVIITYLPWHDTFLKLLVALAELRRSDQEEFRAFLAEAYKRGVPEPNCSLRLYYHNGQSQFVFDRPLLPRLPSIPESYNLNLYYNFVSAKNMIEVFAAMLAERRIIFTSRHLDRLSSCVHAAAAFLYPMEWQHIFIPLLPMKMKDHLGAPMPYLIGVPESVLATMMPEELGDVVILNCDTSDFTNPFDDVRDLPADIVSQLKQQLNTRDHIGDSISKIFLRVLVQLIGGYRDAVEFRESGKKFNREKFIESRPSHLRAYISKMMQLQLFEQFIDERLEKLNAGLGISDEFETETVRYAEKMKKRGLNYAFLKNVKDKTNPAVKSAVKTVKQSTKTAYKDLKSKFRDITPPSGGNNSNAQHLRSHLTSNSQHDRIDGNLVGRISGGTHHSAPSSPVFGKRAISTPNATGGFKYASPESLNGNAKKVLHRPNPLAISSSIAHVPNNAYTHANHLNNHLAASPNVSPASSLCSSEMNLSQELQNHPLFKSSIAEQSSKSSHHHFDSKPPLLAATKKRLIGTVMQYNVNQMIDTNAGIVQYRQNHNAAIATQKQQTQQQTQQQQQQKANTKHALQRSLPICTKNRVLQTTCTTNRIVTTKSIYDTPPEFVSPPVPPRRQTSTPVAAAAVAMTDHGATENSLRSSSSSNNSTASSNSNASFMSAASCFSQYHHAVNAAETVVPVPVPAPRLKKDKEPKDANNATISTSTSALPVAISNDLITLDDSKNSSFELEDFDPLNKNARPLPVSTAKKCTTLPTGTTPASFINSNCLNNPLYPYFAPRQQQQQQQRLQKLAHATTAAGGKLPQTDDDFELLRKYGLDQFSLQTNGTIATTATAATTAAAAKGIGNWTTFD